MGECDRCSSRVNVILIQDDEELFLRCQSCCIEDGLLTDADRTKALVARKVDWTEFTLNLAASCIKAKKSVFVESSRPDTRGSGYDVLVKSFKKGGATLRDYWDVTYYGTSESALARFTFGDDDGFNCDLSGMDDEHTPLEALKQYPAGQVVLDPCTGLGLTSRAAAEAGPRSSA